MDATALLAVDPAGLSGPELSARVIALVRLRSLVDAALVAAIDGWDEAAVWASDGAISGTAWLAFWCDQSGELADRLLHLSRTLRAMPHTAAAFAEGHLSTEKVELLAALAAGEQAAEALALDEATLVTAVANLAVDEAARVLRSWSALADRTSFAANGERQRAQRRFDLVQRVDGQWKAEARLDPESGAIVSTAVARMVDELFRSAPDVDAAELGLPSPGQQEADALVELARRASATPPGSTPSPPLLVVFVNDGQPHDQEQGRPGLGRTDGGEPLPPVVVQRLRCDVWVATTVDTGPPEGTRSGPLVRTVTDAQQRALWVRDGGCVFPGCRRPPSGCEAHRIAPAPPADTPPAEPRQAGEDEAGTEVPADLAELCLVCTVHHRLLHEGGFGVTRLGDGRLPFTRPDGSPLLESRGRLDAYGRPTDLPPYG